MRKNSNEKHAQGCWLIDDMRATAKIALVLDGYFSIINKNKDKSAVNLFSLYISTQIIIIIKDM
jgi:hypothetical protein